MNPLYFLDEMSQDEVSAVMKAKSEQDRDIWEQTRTLSFYIVAVQQGKGTKIKSPSDLFKLPWDEDTKVKGRKKTEEEMIKFHTDLYGVNKTNK